MIDGLDKSLALAIKKVGSLVRLHSARRVLRQGEYLLGTILVVGLLLLAAVYVLSSSVSITGKVISANTKTPISGALVAVESDDPFNENGFGSYVKTDQDGKFEAKAKGKWIRITVWGKGYAVNEVSYGYAIGRVGQETIIELREVNTAKQLPIKDAFYDLPLQGGFSFSLARVVEGNNADAFQHSGIRSLEFT